MPLTIFFALFATQVIVRIFGVGVGVADGVGVGVETTAGAFLMIAEIIGAENVKPAASKFIQPSRSPRFVVAISGEPS